MGAKPPTATLILLAIVEDAVAYGLIGAVFVTEEDGAKASKGFAGATLVTPDADGAKPNPLPATVVDVAAVVILLLRLPVAVDVGPGKPPNVLETDDGKAPVIGTCDGANPAAIPEAGVGAKLAKGLAAGAPIVALVGANEFVGNGFCCCCCCCCCCGAP